MKKVLIFYASYGGGHLNAAKSINEYIKTIHPEINVEFIDCMKYIDKTFEKISTTAYRETAKIAPWLWGKIYYDSQKGPLASLTSRSNKVLAIKLLRLLRSKNPDLIISTHPFGSQMCSYLKRKRKINAKIATILTDYAPHKQWLIEHSCTDYFFVAHEGMKKYFVDQGISEKKVFSTGIPLSSRFLDTYDKSKVMKDFDLNKNKKTILFFGGGEFGLGKTRTFELFENLISNIHDGYQILAISGKNQKMNDIFNQLVINNNCTDNVKVISFTDKIPELMSISELIITKPGGMTTTESLSAGLPMIIINPIPGQEEENAEFLENYGIAKWINKEDDISLIVNSLLSNTDELHKMKYNSKKLSKNNSTANICNIILN